MADRPDLFQGGDFTLASGQRSNFKIECDALSEQEWACLAAMAVDRLPPFSEVYGVPRGGIPFADALRPHCKPGAYPVIIADDVWTTGGSMRRFIADLTREKPELRGRSMVGTVVFARNEVHGLVYPLFTLAKKWR